MRRDTELDGVGVPQLNKRESNEGVWGCGLSCWMNGEFEIVGEAHSRDGDSSIPALRRGVVGL